MAHTVMGLPIILKKIVTAIERFPSGNCEGDVSSGHVARGRNLSWKPQQQLISSNRRGGGSEITLTQPVN